jgi:hypothetical protein
MVELMFFRKKRKKPVIDTVISFQMIKNILFCAQKCVLRAEFLSLIVRIEESKSKKMMMQKKLI